MTASTVSGRNGDGARSGARTLNLLAAPLNSLILGALRDGPRQQVELRRETGQPAQTTLRAQLKRLCDASVVEKRRRNHFPGVLEYELSEAGHDLVPVAAVLQRWLELSPAGPMELGTHAAKTAVKALAEGWITTMLRALATKPLTLTDLDGLISAHNYPSLERRLAAMRVAALVETMDPDRSRGTPYDMTEWGRQSAAPIVAAIHWEHQHVALEAPLVTKIDIETAFLLATGLLSLPAGLCGTCRLAVELRDGKAPALAGVLIDVRAGTLVSSTTRLEGEPDAWASGPTPDWLVAMTSRDVSGLELGGDGALARHVIEGLHAALFAPPVTKP